MACKGSADLDLGIAVSGPWIVDGTHASRIAGSRCSQGPLVVMCNKCP